VDSPNQAYSWGYDFNHESQHTKDFVDPLAENSILTVLNCTGKVVRLLEMKGNQDQVDLSSLRPGLYILSRRCRKEAPEYVKVVKE